MQCAQILHPFAASLGADAAAVILCLECCSTTLRDTLRDNAVTWHAIRTSSSLLPLELGLEEGACRKLMLAVSTMEGSLPLGDTMEWRDAAWTTQGPLPFAP